MSRRPDLREAPALLRPEQAEEVRSALERILTSHPFRGSRRCQSLLRHITERTLAGDVHSLKERTLGMEVFERPPDYDSSQDPVVRKTAAEIRKKLAQYYQEPGHDLEPHIDLLSGSYVAEFHLNGGRATRAVSRARRKRYLIVAACLVIPALLIVATGLLLQKPKRTGLDLLWAPLVQAPGPILICVGQPIVYNLKSTYAQDTIQGIVPGTTSGAPSGAPGLDDVIHGRDLLILGDRYVDLGDAVSLAHLAALLDRRGKLFRIRGERSTSFADVSDGPSVLIGAFNNQWTLRANDQLRYFFVKDSVHEVDMIRDRQHPDSTPWKLTRVWPYWDVPIDYAIVSRITDARTNRPMIIVAGITRHGTMAAGEFLTNPEYFAEAVAKFPPGWEKKNLQVVLNVAVVNRVAGRPRVLATAVW